MFARLSTKVLFVWRLSFPDGGRGDEMTPATRSDIGEDIFAPRDESNGSLARGSEKIGTDCRTVSEERRQSKQDALFMAQSF